MRRSNQIPTRKRFTRKKRRSNDSSKNSTRSTNSLDNSSPPSDSGYENHCPNSSHDMNVASPQKSTDSSTKFKTDWRERSDVLINFHDYACSPGETVGDSSALKATEVITEPIQVPLELLFEVKEKLQPFLSHRWVPIVHRNAVHVVHISAQNNLTVKRSLVFLPSGAVELFVHCQPITVNRFVDNVDPPLPLENSSLNYFVDRAVTIINKVNAFEICSGYDDDKFKAAWSSCPYGEVDKNPYQECRYVETFRSFSCLRLVNSSKWRCQECSKLYRPLKRRSYSADLDEPHEFTNFRYLTDEQKLKKLKNQRRELDCKRKKILRLQDRMQDLIKKGFQIDTALSKDLTDILNGSTLTPAQSIFLQQQVKASQQTNMVSMRWHPTFIRLALALHITSPKAYEMLRDTGMVKLPSSRTLFDYTHAKPVQEGIDPVVQDSLGERVKKLKKSQTYHVLMADEMHICSNLVFQKSSGRMVGYTSLDDVDKEVQNMEQYFSSNQTRADEKMASKVLTYMIKGVSSGIKEVVATYGVSTLSASQLYLWTWKVIGAMERTGIAIIAFVCDGCSTNRAFIKKHKPVTILASGVIFDTKNKCAPHRRLFFISDIPHLLKTIRNNLLNSKSDKKKGRRHMVLRGKKITWDFISKLYKEKSRKAFRKSYKLNAMNVSPDSYARMKVKYAAEVLSRTVAQDLEDQKWDRASETICFIRFVNDWFDCLNGAHSTVGTKKRNDNLKPYTSKEDKRFDFLESFLKYLDDWKKEAQGLNENVNTSAASGLSLDQSNVEGDDITIDSVEEGRERLEEETPASKRILSYQTLEGIERSTRAFIDMVKYLLEEGTKFINARIFTQDPLEQHFSKVRAGQGGSTNPNLGQILYRNRALHIIGQLGMKRKKGNCGECETTVEVTTEPLPKRKCERSSIFMDC